MDTQSDHDEFVDLVSNGVDPGLGEDDEFEVIGMMEEIIMSDKFAELQNGFGQKHYHQFEDTDENKLIYTELFEQYSESIEKFIDQELTATVENFSMERFFTLLSNKTEEELDGEVFDILMTLGDFSAFKDFMLSHNPSQQHSGFDISVIPVSSARMQINT